MLSNFLSYFSIGCLRRVEALNIKKLGFRISRVIDVTLGTTDNRH